MTDIPLTTRIYRSQYLPMAILAMFLSIAIISPKLFDFFANPSASKIDYDPSQYCELSTVDCVQKNVTMTLDTDVLRPLKNARIYVDWPGNESQQLNLKLQGVEMNLGDPEFTLVKQENGLYRGIVMLPVCADVQMTWAGTLTDEKRNKIYASIRMEE